MLLSGVGCARAFVLSSILDIYERMGPACDLAGQLFRLDGRTAVEKAPKPVEPASARDSRAVEPASVEMAAPQFDVRPGEAAAVRAEPPQAPNEKHSTAREQQHSHSGDGAGSAMPEHAGAARDLSRLSPADQAMFAKVRGKVAADVPDETVAAAMLAAKRNGIPDAESIGPVGVANGKL